MSEAKSTTSFIRAAVDFDVAESDFLVLLNEKINTFEGMTYRYPTSADFEEFLKKTVRLQAAYKDGTGNILVWPKPTPPAWEDFKRCEDAGCLRKLWQFSSQVSKKELENLASAGEDVKHKITLTTSKEWEDRAISEGMPVPLSDKERPSLFALGRVQTAYSTGGTFEYLSWETFADAELEGRLKRAGKLPKDRQELAVEGSKVTIEKKNDDQLLAKVIEDAADLREVLDIRARTFHIAKVAEFMTCRTLTERYLSKMRATQIAGMRPPTINEIRRCDRELFQEILSRVARGQGSVELGLKHYLNHQEEPVWKLLESQIQSMPDQGVEAKPGSAKKRKAAEASEDDRNKRPEGADYKPEGPRYCIVCKRRHEPRCPMTEEFRQAQRDRKKAAQKARKAREENRRRPSGRDGGGEKAREENRRRSSGRDGGGEKRDKNPK
eukprot:s309_g4.t1